MDKNFKLSELGEFGLILKMENKNEFVEKFTCFVRGLVFDAAFCRHYLPPVASHGFYSSSDSIAYDIEMANANWEELVHGVDYVGDQQKEAKVCKSISDYARCRTVLKKLWKGGLCKIYNNRYKRKVVRKIMRTRDMLLSYQDIFSVATSYYVSKNWGKEEELKTSIKSMA